MRVQDEHTAAISKVFAFRVYLVWSRVCTNSKQHQQNTFCWSPTTLHFVQGSAPVLSTLIYIYVYICTDYINMYTQRQRKRQRERERKIICNKDVMIRLGCSKVPRPSSTAPRRQHNRDHPNFQQQVRKATSNSIGVHISQLIATAKAVGYA